MSAELLDDVKNPQGTGSAGLRRSMLSLGAVNAIDMALQILLPMLLVRLLSDVDFGQYRALWLVAGTAVGVLAMGVPASLFYFAPRLATTAAASFVRQAGLYMALAGLLACGLTLAWTVWQDQPREQSAKVALFTGAWVFASLLDSLFNAQRQVGRQASVNLVFALLRALLIVAAAWVTTSWSAVLSAHLALVAVKALACAMAIRYSSAGGAQASVAGWREQWHYCSPFGLSSALYLLRGRADQWLVASLFSAAQFGLYSVAAVFTPIQGLIRSTVNQVVLPEMNRLEAAAHHGRMLELNQRGNLAVAFIMFPTLAFLSIWADELLSVLFTADYRQAAMVVRAYALVLLIESMEVTMILTAMRQGRFMMRVDAAVLVCSLAVSLAGAHVFGLPGAALGGVAGALLAQTAGYWRCSRLLGRSLPQLQAWPVLLRVLTAAVLAGMASPAVYGFTPNVSRWVALLTAAVIFCLVYRLLMRPLGLSGAFQSAFGERLHRGLGFQS